MLRCRAIDAWRLRAGGCVRTLLGVHERGDQVVRSRQERADDRDRAEGQSQEEGGVHSVPCSVEGWGSWRTSIMYLIN